MHDDESDPLYVTQVGVVNVITIVHEIHCFDFLKFPTQWGGTGFPESFTGKVEMAIELKKRGRALYMYGRNTATRAFPKAAAEIYRVRGRKKTTLLFMGRILIEALRKCATTFPQKKLLVY